MTRERWEVRWDDPKFNDEEHWDPMPGDIDPEMSAREMAESLRERGMGRVRVVRIVPVEVVYAWRSELLPGPAHWLIAGLDRLGLTHWTMSRDRRTLFADPLGKHSRRRAKAAALAAKPEGPCVLVAIRRRIKEGGDRGLREAGGGAVSRQGRQHPAVPPE